MKTKIYKNRLSKIIYGDVFNGLELIPKNSIDLIFIDPPYNIGKKFGDFIEKWNSQEEYIEWCYRWIDGCMEKLKDNGTMYIMTSTEAMPYFDIYIRKKMTILSRIVWTYDSSGVQAKKYYGSLYEPILFCVKNKNNYTFNYEDILIDAKTGSTRKLIDYRGKRPKPYNTQKVPGNNWYFPRVRYRMAEYEKHPSQKPEKLLERVIRASSNEGDTVLDPFAGTFTTSAVATKLKRQSISIENQEDYLKIGLRRLDICSEFEGEILEKEFKSYQVKNKDRNLFNVGT
ncbi:MAG: adenine-specific DNA-methyltransferase [Campylobacterota bacterium]|nr:adenine-specific DNA-methyltransferase [Campylobacterota bacterium]